MEYKIIYKSYAERDIWEIADYLSDYSADAVKSFLRELKEKIEGLEKMPQMYPKIAPHDYRKIVIGNYVAVYIVNEQLKEILIVRVVHGKRNYQDDLL
ncbi:MAG: type II toxin-antitoxin system RelE/ParE family toxin [Defluviitaleaceae bacterium]|nr:type II toxin-antitoxin system RelE/ParE family toxin [Defluviitaleaceae bacterium]